MKRRIAYAAALVVLSVVAIVLLLAAPGRGRLRLWEPPPRGSYVEMTVHLLERGKLAEARALAQQAVAAGRDDPQSWLVYGWVAQADKANLGEKNADERLRHAASQLSRIADGLQPQDRLYIEKVEWYKTAALFYQAAGDAPLAQEARDVAVATAQAWVLSDDPVLRQAGTSYLVQLRELGNEVPSRRSASER